MQGAHRRCDCRHLHRSCHPHWTAAPGDMKLKTNLHACHAYMYTYVYLCTCVCVRVCVCVCVYIIYIIKYAYTNIHVCNVIHVCNSGM